MNKKGILRTGMVAIIIPLSIILVLNLETTIQNPIKKADISIEKIEARIFQRKLSLEIPEKNNIENEIFFNPRAFSTFLGGSSKEKYIRISTDSEDNVIVAGNTISDDFPKSNSSKQPSNGQFDVFITKFSPTGEQQWGTFLRGANQDLCFGIAVDSQDNIIISGETNSSDFPVLNSYQVTKNDQSDVFIAKFSSTGEIKWSTYLGGQNDDHNSDIAVDSQDNIIITGYTNSINFPTINTTNLTLQGRNDAFISKFSSNGELKWSILMGGQNEDYLNGITVDSKNEITIIGNTKSEDFATSTFNTPLNNNSFDIFILKMTENGSLVWKNLLGGISDDFSTSISSDSQNNVIFTGYTNSSDFPTLNAFSDTYTPPFYDGFVTKLSPKGEIEWSTYIGGVANDSGNDVAIDPQNNILITGNTWSYNFPTKNGYDDMYNRAGDSFITKFSTTGQHEWGMFLGGISKDLGLNIAIDSQNYVIVTGITSSTNFPVKNPSDETYNGETDCFIYHMLDPLLDRDDDKIPDYWELEMGLNPNNTNDAGLDIDKDGLTNLQEFNLGLNPNNPDYDSDRALDGEEIDQLLLDPKNAFFNPGSRIIILLFVIVVPGIPFIILSLRWRAQSLKR